MSRASSNAFKGYNFQGSLYEYFFCKMDLDREIIDLDAEVSIDNNFDDLYVRTENESFYFQVKNYNDVDYKKIKFTQDGIKISGRELIDVKSNAEYINNVLVVRNLSIPEEDITNIFFGIKCVKKYDYYIAGYSDNLFNETVREDYRDDTRYSNIINVAESRINDDNFKITINELPPLVTFNQKLQQETLLVRNFELDFEDNILFIEGKAGVGKSHLVNELEKKKIVDNYILERLWISEKDKDKKNRIIYDNFIKDLSYNLFGKAYIETEDEIVEELKSKRILLIIDGLDHVENYNNDEFDKYIEFIDKIKESKVLILSRPLKKQLNYRKIELNDWSRDESDNYVKSIIEADYDLCRNIFNMAHGYPIITYFLCEYYIVNGVIPEFNDIGDLYDFYDKLILEGVNGLSTFLIANNTYLKYSDLKNILSANEYNIVDEIIKRNPYLFSIKGQRIYLIHDSLNGYLRARVPNYIDVNADAITKICNSLKDDEIRFMSRISYLDIPNEMKIEFAKKYCSFDNLKSVMNKTIDYEMIWDIVHCIGTIISENRNEFSIEYLYEYVLIEQVFSRLNYDYSLLFTLIQYYRKNNLIDYEALYSSGYLYSIYSCIEQSSYEPLREYLKNSYFDVEGEINQFEKAMYEYFHYYDIKNDELDPEVYLNEKITNMDFKDRDILKYLVCNLYIRNVEYKDIDQIAVSIMSGNEEKAIGYTNKLFYKYHISSFFSKSFVNGVKQYLFSLGVETEENFYKKDSLEKVISVNSCFGSFNLSGVITNYIRLAIIEKRKIDIQSVNNYFYMYHQRKDYSVESLPLAMIILNRKDMFDYKHSIDIISGFIDMSEKGIRTLLTDYFNLMSIEEIEKYKKYATDNLIIGDLTPDRINVFSKNEIEEYFNSHDIHYHFNSRNIDYDSIKNFLNSNYSELIMEILEIHNFSIEGIPLSEFDIKKMVNKNDYKTPPFDSRDYIVESDSEELQSRKIDCETLAMFHDGNYDALPFTNLFNIYTKDDIVKKMYNIIFNATFLDTKYDMYANKYLMMGNVLKLLDDYDYKDIDWSSLLKSIICFIEISTNKKIA